MNSALSVLVKPITEEFGWKRSVFSGASTIGTLLGGFGAMFVGTSIDRFGAKWVLFFAFLITGVLFFLLSITHGIWLFFIVMILGRFLLQAVINVADAVVVPKWFIRKRGRATAIASLGPRFGTGMLPLISERITSGFGWRAAALSIGVMAWAITLAPVLLWLKRLPEDMGLTPDGKAEPKKNGAQERSKPRFGETNYTLREVLRFRGFWVLLVGFTLSQFVSTGINFNMYPYLTDQGISDSQAILVVSVWSLVAIPMTLVGGFIAERMPHRYVLFIIFVGLMIGSYVLTLADSFGLGMVFAIVHGAFFGAMLLFQTMTFADYYGRKSLGAVRGFATIFFMIANALGPLAATLVFDFTGSYLPIMRVYVAISLVIAIAMAFAKPPQPKAESATPMAAS